MMWKLMKLEWKKNNLKKYIVKAAAVTVILFLLLFMTSGELESKETVEIYGQSMIYAAIKMFADSCFILCTGVMLASVIISAYRNKTMNLMFSYPIKRQKILFSQMLVVWIFNFVALVLCKLFLFGGFFLLGNWTGIALQGITSGEIFGQVAFWLELAMDSAAMVSISYVVLFVGMRAKSSKAAILTSFLVIVLTQGNIGSYTLINNVPFYLALTVLAAVSVFLCVYKIEERDVV